MLPNEEGFLMPSVNGELCNECGSCTVICPFETKKESKPEVEQKVFACQATEQKLLIEATAGGVFPVLARWILNNEGVVFGAAYDKKMNVVHRAATKLEDLKAFNGSKYVQSDSSDAIVEAKKYLQNGRCVLFSGTPCQIYALNRFCEDISTAKLYTMDVVCYGVPSPGLFRAYVDIIEKNHNAKVIDFRFRDKHKNGWSHTTVITLQKPDGGITYIEESDYSKIAYYKMFGSRNCFRKSCYHCLFNTISRVSDITTGNFWGIEKISRAFDAHLGVSMAILNTRKGIQLFGAVQSEMIQEVHSVDEAIRANDALEKGCTPSKQRDMIYRYFTKKGFSKTSDRFYTLNHRKALRVGLSKIKQALLKKLRRWDNP